MKAQSLYIPPYIRLPAGRWARSDRATVAMWREALAVAERPMVEEDRDLQRHAKRQWRVAVEVLRFAVKRGMGDHMIAFESFIQG
jgi:hypothetical protein